MGTADAAGAPRQATTSSSRRASVERVGGYMLYLAWMLAVFYNTFLLTGAADIKATLYLNMLPSMASLALTLLALPFAARHADKRVLSRSWTLGAGILMAASTALLPFADAATATGRVITVASAVLTGFSSGVLFLGWMRIFTDAGPRRAMAEISLAFLGAAIVDALLTQLSPLVALVLAVVAALASALLLRRAAFSRPKRPRPMREHRLHRRTRLLFARGLVATASVGLVAGFLDVLAGFHYVPVPQGYELLLALGAGVAALVMLAVARLVQESFVAVARRVVLVALVLGCLLTVLIERIPGLPEVVVLGAYQVGYAVMLCAICIDVSNYFDQPATRAFGVAFGCMYVGEALGNSLAQFLALGLGVASVDLPIVTFLLSAVLVLVTTFLFTEGDLVETSVGELVDDETAQRGDDALGGFSARIGARENGADSAAGAGLGDAATAAAENVHGGRAGAPDGDGTGAAGTSGQGVVGATMQGNAPADGRGATVAGEAATPRDIDAIAAELAAEYGLTPREGEVLPLILRGRTLARIQEELHISQGTAGTHTRHIYQKIGVHNRQALIDMLEQRQMGGRRD